jgi:membrane protein YqaA with SNARE-associated domain
MNETENEVAPPDKIMTTVSNGRPVIIEKQKWWELPVRILGLLVAIAITVGIYLARDQIAQLPAYGFPTVFLISLLGNASVIVPAPSFAVAFVAGGSLNPIAVGVIAGLGAALGELTGYLAGASGKGVVDRRPTYQKLRRGMEKSGFLVIFTLGVVPNFLFDVGGILAGAVRMPVWQFLLAAWLGKSIRLSIVAATGYLWLQ